MGTGIDLARRARLRAQREDGFRGGGRDRIFPLPAPEENETPIGTRNRNPQQEI